MRPHGVEWTIFAFEIDWVDGSRKSVSADDRKSELVSWIKGDGEKAIDDAESAALPPDSIMIDYYISLTPQRRETDRPLIYLYVQTRPLETDEAQKILYTTAPNWDRAVVARAFRYQYADATLYEQMITTDEGDNIERSAATTDEWARAVLSGDITLRPTVGYIGQEHAHGLDIVYRLRYEHDFRLRLHVGSRETLQDQPSAPAEFLPLSRHEPDDIETGEVGPYWATTHRGCRLIDPEFYPANFVEDVIVADGVADAATPEVSPDCWFAN